MIQHQYKFQQDVALELGQRPLIMGILNVTPDSFSDGGLHQSVDEALRHTAQLVEDGADIIDVGGESTRPGFTPVSEEEEISRVIPVIEAIRRQFPQISISIDTYKAKTAEYALQAGAHIINDIWCLTYDPNMAIVAAKYNCPVILNHNRPANDYTDVVQDVIADLQRSVQIARNAGIEKHNIWLDPGIGFAKDYEQNMMVHAHLDKICDLGYPVLLGTSRKKFIRETLQVDAAETSEGTLVSNLLGVQQGCQIVRVHDVRAMKRALTMLQAINGRR